MAYAAAINVQHLGKGRYTVSISETECAATSEAVITGLPLSAVLLKQVTALTSGTGATVNPIIGLATNPAGISILAENETAAASVNNIASPQIPFATASGTLYHRSRPNAGADNAILSRYLFQVGW